MRTRFGAAAAILLAAHPSPSPAAEAWLAYPDAGRIVACPVSNGGEPGAASIAARTGASGCAPALALGPDGLPAASWLADDGAVLFARFDGSGWSAPETVSPPSGLHRGLPSLAIAGGVAAVAWAEEADGGFEDVFYALRSDGRWGLPRRAHEENGVPDILPEARAGTDGTLGLSWQSLDGDRYVERRIGAAVPAPGSSSLDPGLPARLFDAGFPLESALAWRGAEGIPASARLKDLIDVARRTEEAASEGTRTAEAFRTDAGARTVIAFGDSITYGRGSSTNGPRTGYPAFLNGILMYNYPGQRFEMINEGDPGEQTPSGLNRIDDVLRRYRADCILIMEGTNDIYRLLAPRTIQQNLEKMASKARKQGVLPILSTVIPTVPYGDRAEQYQRTKQFYYGRYVQDLAARLNLACADQWAAFAGVPNWARVAMDQASGNHPNDNGYRYVMAPEWYETLRPVLDGILPFTPYPPHLDLAAAPAAVAPGSSVTISYALTPSNDQVLNGVDCYAAVRTPQGGLLYFDPSWGLTPSATPFFRKALLSDLPRAGVLANLAIPRTAPPGSYTFYLLAVRALRSVDDRGQWSGNLAETAFRVVR
jgi:lysophospholipase L1-like esterase